MGLKMGCLGWFCCSAKMELCELESFTRALFIAIINQIQRSDFELPVVLIIKIEIKLK